MGGKGALDFIAVQISELDSTGDVPGNDEFSPRMNQDTRGTILAE